jgi:dipeptidyl aminopeptidase/acylaminoacyl peptidase
VGLDQLRREDIERARGERQPVPQGEHVFQGLRGTPYLSRFARYAPVEVADRITQPTLLIDAENEELFDIREHSQRVYQRIKDRVPSKYHVVPGIKHYGIYRERLRESYALAIEWFDRYLEPRSR